ncbi:transposase [Pontibacter mucosus]|uniref:transposase n=1 Tax=Pontibacter mucosus TaxID=1649266 RepID=UPI0014748288|nr:transposase [Pontibacter mucosus]
MSHGRYELSQRQWELVKEGLPPPSVREDGEGRPSRSDRELLNGMFWILWAAPGGICQPSMGLGRPFTTGSGNGSS